MHRSDALYLEIVVNLSAMRSNEAFESVTHVQIFGHFLQAALQIIATEHHVLNIVNVREICVQQVEEDVLLGWQRGACQELQ